jgi:asparagine N-glycosylation enzyme membrane subunit Stt3
LGQWSFDTDEFLHLVAAQQLIRSGEPTLPSGNHYDRALLYTRLVQVSFQLFGVSEASARLPSVIFGTLLILLTYLIGHRWFGTWPALFAAALVAFSPLSVGLARMCRMYSVFQCLYLGFLYAYERGWEAPNLPFRRRLAWSGVALVLLLGSLHMHILTLDFFAALVVYWAVLSLACWRSRYSLYLLITATAVLISVATGLLDLVDLWEQTTYVPPYSSDLLRPLYYVSSWAILYPWLWIIVPLAALFQCLRYGRTGFFISCQFAIPFLLHSLVFRWQSERFIAHLVPVLALLIAPFLSWSIEVIALLWQRFVRPRSRQQSLIGKSVASVIVVTLSLLLPLAHCLRLQYVSSLPQWREVYALLAERIHTGEALIVSVPFAESYYLGKPGTHALNNFRLAIRNHAPKQNADGFFADWYSGLPLLTSLSEFRQVRAAYPRGWVVVDQRRFQSPKATPPELREYLRRHCRAYPVGPDRSVVVFWWDDMSGSVTHAEP